MKKLQIFQSSYKYCFTYTKRVTSRPAFARRCSLQQVTLTGENTSFIITDTKQRDTRTKSPKIGFGARNKLSTRTLSRRSCPTNKQLYGALLKTNAASGRMFLKKNTSKRNGSGEARDHISLGQCQQRATAESVLRRSKFIIFPGTYRS